MEVEETKRDGLKEKQQFEIENLLEVLNQSSKKEKKKGLIKLLYGKIDPLLFKIYKPPSKSMSGKSGAVIMIDETEKPNIKTIMKQMKTNTSIKIKDGTCIKTSNNLNEILINLVMNNLGEFIEETDKLEFVKHYIIEIKGFGSEKKKSYIIQGAVGINAIFDEEKDYYYFREDEKSVESGETVKKKNLTNLHDMFVYNYIPILIKLCQNYDVNKFKIELFIKYIIHMTSLYANVLNILNDKIGFCHGDMKLTNVFIKKHIFTAVEGHFTEEDLRLLKEECGFIIDILPVISDLDRSRLYIKNHTISSMPTGKYGNTKISRTKRAQTIGISNTTYKSRYKCSSDKTIKCKTTFFKTSSLYTSSHFDNLSIILNIFILFDIDVTVEKRPTTILKLLYKKKELEKFDDFMISKFNTDNTTLTKEYIRKMIDTIITTKHGKETYDLFYIRNNHTSANKLGNMAQDFLCEWTKKLKTKRTGGSRKKIRKQPTHKKTKKQKNKKTKKSLKQMNEVI